MIGLSKCRACGRYFFVNPMYSDCEVPDALPQICAACDGSPIDPELEGFVSKRDIRPLELNESDLERLKEIQRDAAVRRLKVFDEAKLRNEKTSKKKRGKKD